MIQKTANKFKRIEPRKFTVQAFAALLCVEPVLIGLYWIADTFTESFGPETTAQFAEVATLSRFVLWWLCAVGGVSLFALSLRLFVPKLVRGLE